MSPAELSAPTVLGVGLGRRLDGRRLDPADALALVEELAATSPPGPAAPDYSSPEQVRGEQLTPASQVYALAAILFHALTGEAPFAAARASVKPFWHVRSPRPHLRAQRPDLPLWLDGLVRRGMAIVPEERPADPRAFLAEVDAIATPEPAPAAERGTAWRPRRSRAAPDPGTAASPGPPAPVASRPRPDPLRRRWIAALAATVLVACAVGAGYLSASLPRTETPTPPTEQRIALGGNSLALPPDWRTTEAAFVPGLPAGRGIAITPTTGGGTLVADLAGRASRGGGALPDTLRASLTAAPRPGERVALQFVEAVRYRGLRLRGLEYPVTLYSVPTVAGVTAVLCVPTTDPAFTGVCDRAAATLKVEGSALIPISPAVSYAVAAEAALVVLERRRRRALATMRGASAGSEQSASAATLALAYERAAGALRRAPAAPPANAAIVRNLQALARRFRALGKGAEAGDAAAYADARRAIRSADRELRSAIAGLRHAGYRPRDAAAKPQG